MTITNVIVWYLFIQMCATCQPILFPGEPFRSEAECKAAFAFIYEQGHAERGVCIPKPPKHK